MEIRTSAVGVVWLLLAAHCFSAPNIILVSGGPSIYDREDPERHDKSWDNFVTSPGLMFNAKLLPPSSDKVEVWWFVFRPAYKARWEDDTKADDFRKEHTTNVLKSASSYVDLIEKKAAERKWKLRWIESADEFWNKLESFQELACY
jgi:hypothetical protein